MTKCMVAVVHHYSIRGLSRCESPGSFACCVKFPCYLMLLYTAADQRSRIQLSAGSMTRSRPERTTSDHIAEIQHLVYILGGKRLERAKGWFECGMITSFAIGRFGLGLDNSSLHANNW